MLTGWEEQSGRGRYGGCIVFFIQLLELGLNIGVGPWRHSLTQSFLQRLGLVQEAPTHPIFPSKIRLGPWRHPPNQSFLQRLGLVHGGTHPPNSKIRDGPWRILPSKIKDGHGVTHHLILPSKSREDPWRHPPNYSWHQK